jgi:hypothetical protein
MRASTLKKEDAMPQYSGITTKLDQARAQQTKAKKGLRKWQLANGGQPFPSRQAAMDWLKKQPGAHDPFMAPSPGKWFGYSFEHN